MTVKESARRDDAGLSLMELVVYMLLATVVITIVATIMINSFRVDAQVRDSAASAGESQSFIEIFGQSIRNAAYVELVSDSSDAVLVRTQSLSPEVDGEWVCDVWLLSDGRLSWGTSQTEWPSTIPGAAGAGLVVLATNVEPRGGVPVLDQPTERGITIQFDATSAAGVRLTVDTTIVSRQPRSLWPEERTQCFGAP